MKPIVRWVTLAVTALCLVLATSAYADDNAIQQFRTEAANDVVWMQALVGQIDKAGDNALFDARAKEAFVLKLERTLLMLRSCPSDKPMAAFYLAPEKQESTDPPGTGLPEACAPAACAPALTGTYRPGGAVVAGAVSVVQVPAVAIVARRPAVTREKTVTKTKTVEGRLLLRLRR